MKEDFLTSYLLKKGNLVSIQLNNGTKMEGFISEIFDNATRLNTPQGESVDLTPQMLADTTYLYFGFPLKQEETETPAVVKSNGTIVLINNMAMVDGEKGKRVIKLHAGSQFTSLQLKEMEGDKILFVIQEDGNAYILPQDTLDQTLDRIVSLANSGNTKLAILFCEELVRQFPKYNDLNDVLSDIKERDAALHSLTKKDANIVEKVKILPPSQTDELSARGYIFNYDVNNPMGIVVDVASHQILRFYTEDCYGGLKRLSPQEMIGKPVTYTITKIGRKEEIGAKTILPIMTIENACFLADDLYYDEHKQRTACDILRIALKEGNKIDIKEAFDDWIEEVKKGGKTLWKEEQLPPYQDIPLLQYDFRHFEKVLVSEPPAIPQITFNGDLDSEKVSAPIEVPTKQEELSFESMTTTSAEITKIQVPPEYDLSKMTDKEIEDSYMAEDVVPANGTMTFRLYVGTGGTIRANTADGKLYLCNMDDIIDEDLYEKASTSNGTQYIREEPIVCLMHDNGKATAISKPDTVASMLKKARDLFTEVMSSQDEDNDNNTDNRLFQLRMALGFTSHVEHFAPQNPLTSQISGCIKAALNKFSANSYKAPAGSLHFTGYVMNKRKRMLEDVRFEESKRPKFTQEDIVDPDYINRGTNIGDELMYSVYNDGHSFPHARFVHRAMSEIQLLALAKEWEMKGVILNAWGIAKNIADANPDSEKANALIEKYESMTMPDGTNIISEEVKNGRQQPITQSFFKQARQAQEQKLYLDAINYYKAAIIDDYTALNIKSLCVGEIINIYSMLYRANPNEATLYQKYKEFGRMHIEGSDESIFIRSKSKMILTTIRLIITYYLDMRRYEDLMEAYDKGIGLIDKKINENKNANIDELNNEKAKWWAWKAWIQLRIEPKGYAKAQSYAEIARKISGNQELVQVSLAVCNWRKNNGNEIKEKQKFTACEIKKLDEWSDKSPAVIYQRGEKKNNLVKERFALLYRIIKSPDNSLSYLARYLGTLIYNQEEYYHDLQSNNNVLPDDCWVALQLYHCIQKGISWPNWMDIRLLCMLEFNSAYLICDMLYQLDTAFARDLTVSWDKDFKHETVMAHAFARYFNRWRGTDFQGQYARILNATERTISKETIDDYAEYIRSLERAEWMVQEDVELITTLRQQLPDKLTEYGKAEKSRIIIESQKRISSDIDEGLERIKRRPTVLSLTAFYPLLERVKQVVNEDFGKKRFTEPNPVATLISASALGEDYSMIIEVEIKNGDNFAYAMSDCRLIVSEKTTGLRQTKKAESYSLIRHKLYGGESDVFVIPVVLDPNMKNQENGEIVLDFDYLTDYKEGGNKCTFTLRYPISTDKLENINNIVTYGPEAKGDLFCGRDKYIDNVMSIITKSENTPHFFIYGQKRCGKTSVLHRIREKLQDDPHFIIVDINFLGMSVKCEDDIYYGLIEKTRNSLREYNRKARKNGKQQLEIFEMPEKESINYDSFIESIQLTKELIAETNGWENRKLIFLIDEFTETYNWFNNKVIDSQFLLRWKNLVDMGLFYAIIVAQDVLGSFMNETGHNNAFHVFERKRLTYLEKAEACDLVNKLTLKSTGRNDLYIGNAIDRILYYSANSAFYTRWICKFVIDRIENYHLTSVTTADVEMAVRDALLSEGENTIDSNFDPLTFSGTKEEYSKPTKQEALGVLNKIAEAQNPDEGCIMQPNEVINALIERDVLEPNNLREDCYIIKVKMFILWMQMKKKSVIG